MALLAVLIISSVALTACIRDDPYEFKGGELSPPEAAGALDLVDQDGEPFSLADVEGQVSLIYFGYTTCPDLCPTTLSDFTAVKEELGDDADKVNFIMVTVDPERDSIERLKQYLGFFDPDFVGLRGDVDQTEQVKAEYGVIATKVEYPDSATGYLVDHTSLIYVIDKEGRLRLTYPYGFSPESIVEDIQHLI
jgi:protein SCO1/2